MSYWLRRMNWMRPGTGCSLPSMSFRWLGMSSLHPGASLGSLKSAANGELRDKVALLDGARHEAFEALNSVKRLNEECRGLRGDLH